MRTAGLVLAAAVVLLLASSTFIVNERERAVLFQFGAVQRTDFAPGVHFKLPFLQNVRKFDRRVLTLDTDPERYLTSEKKDVLVDFFVKWRIADVARFYTATSGDEAIAQTRLLPFVRQALGREINERTLQQVVASARMDLIEPILNRIKQPAADLGIEVLDVRVSRIDLPEDGQVTESVYRRMRAERTKVASELRSQGVEAAERIRAEAERARQVLLANANRDAATVRGEGEAEAAQIYAAAYTKDPEFYALYRSLEAYRDAFRDKDGTLVLDPESEFFRYFGDSGR